MRTKEVLLTTNLTNAINRFGKRLKGLTLLGDGLPSGMDEYIENQYTNKDKVQVIMLMKGNRLIGWVWGFQQQENGKRYIDIWVYVKKGYRRMGYGEYLYNTMTERLEWLKRKYRVYPWDIRSTSFYKSIRAI